MSSITSSIPAESQALVLNLKPSWLLAGCFFLWIVLLSEGLRACTGLPGPTERYLGGVVLVAGLLLLLTQLFGVSRLALSAAALLPDGQWLLKDGEGREWTAALSPASRPLAGCLFLFWKSPRGRRWAVVTPSMADPDALRRLRVRLRVG